MNKGMGEDFSGVLRRGSGIVARHSPEEMKTGFKNNQLMSSVPWMVSLLGGLRVERGPLVITHFRSQKFGYLLAYLALTIQKTHTREELCELFWPAAPPDAARGNLRTALASLRKELEPEGVAPGSVLVTHGHSEVGLAPEAVRTDVAAMEERLRAAGATNDPEEKRALLSEAVAFYQGPFLPGCSESWAQMERERLAERYLNALCELAACQQTTGDIPGAIETARRGVSAEPLREEGHRTLVRLLMASGQAVAAHAHIRQFAERLKGELGIEPSAELRSLLAEPKEAVPVAVPAAAPTEPSSAPAAPPSPSAPTTPSTLPPTDTRFFGRVQEVAVLTDLLIAGGVRLATITGAAGSGKTRLAREVALHLRDVLAGKVWYASLADLRNPGDIPGAVAAVLALPPAPASAPLEPITRFLRAAGPSLLVLDNYEHLVEGGAEFARQLLGQAPELRLLVTSRLSLGLSGEQEFPLAPLPVPPAPGTPEQLLAYPSVALFADRARLNRPDFRLTEANAEAISQICHRLDGVPLALELAAGWTQVLTPTQIAARLDDQFALLVTRQRGAPRRHATLRAAIEWSYDLLSPEQQRFFRSLSVFRGSWNWEATEAVTQDPDALLHLTALREHSLLLAAEQDGEMRFSLLGSLRTFGKEALSEEERHELAIRHARYFLSLAESVPGETGEAQMRRFLLDHDNFRAALGWLLKTPGMAGDGLRLATRMGAFWGRHGFAAEGGRWLGEALEHPENATPSRERVYALLAGANLARNRGNADRALARYEECLPLMREFGEEAGVADALCQMGLIFYHPLRDMARARALFEESLALYRTIGHRGGAAHALKCLGAVAQEEGDFASARRFLEESYRLYREDGDLGGQSMVLGELGRVELLTGDLARAGEFLLRHLDLARALHIEMHMASALRLLAEVAHRAGNLPLAHAHLSEALHISRAADDRITLAYTLVEIGRLEQEQGDLAAATRHLRESLPLLEQIQDLPSHDAVKEVLAAIGR